MRKTTIFTLALCLSATVAFAQTQQPIQNGDFEEWTTSGYGPLSSTTCNDWYGLSAGMGGYNYNITKINRTTDAQNGTYAAYIESAPLDAVTATMLQSLINAFDTSGFISNYFDLQTTVFPGLITKGKLDVVSSSQVFFEIAMNLSNVLGTMDSTFSQSDLNTLLSIFDDVDLSEVIGQGMALTGNPDQLSGYYKYSLGTPDSTQTAEDRGVAILLGTYYDTQSMKRKIAGGGATMLTEASSYTNFTVNYSGAGEHNADTAFIFFMSSVYNGLNGTRLYVDNLSMTVRECNDVENIQGSISDDFTTIVLAWSLTPNAIEWEIEYGEESFAIGTGTRVTVSDNNFTIEGLTPPYTIDIYIRSDCGANTYSNWSAKTTMSIIWSVDESKEGNITAAPNPTDGTFTIEAENIIGVEIFDLAGQKVLTDRSGNQTISIDNMPAGVYFLKVETATETRYGKLIKK